MTRFLTNSEMRLFQRCKRKWYLSQYRGLHRRGAYDFNKPLGIGNRVHGALEVYYTPDDKTDPLAWLEKSLDDDLITYPEEQHEAIRKEVDLSRIMLEGYMEWLEETGADQAMTVLEAEQARVVRLEPGRDVFLLAKLDARIKHDELGERLSLDHKTTASLEALLPELRLNTQALTQTLIEKLLDVEAGESDGYPAGTLFNMLKKVKRTVRAKPPFFARHLARHTDSELRNHWRHVIRLSDEIEDAEIRLSSGDSHQDIVPPSPTTDCSWSCPFFHLCPMMDNDSDDHEGFIASKYDKGDPLARYAGQIGASDLIKEEV